MNKYIYLAALYAFSLILLWVAGPHDTVSSISSTYWDTKIERRIWGLTYKTTFQDDVVSLWLKSNAVPATAPHIVWIPEEMIRKWLGTRKTVVFDGGQYHLIACQAYGGGRLRAGDKKVLDFFRQFQGADTNRLASMRKEFHRLLLGSPEEAPTAILFGNDEKGNAVLMANPPTAALTQEQKLRAWATCAILTERNHDSHELLGGSFPTSDTVLEQQKLLEKWWGITSREELLQALEWIDQGGHREEFNRMGAALDSLDDIQIENLKFEMRSDPKVVNKIRVAHMNYKVLEKKSLLGWDYSRYIALCGWGYVAGYLDENEAWEKIMPVARMLQRIFDSWEDVGQNYLIGRQFWSLNETAHGGTEMQRAYEKLCTDPASPWRRYPWEMYMGGEENVFPAPDRKRGTGSLKRP